MTTKGFRCVRYKKTKSGIRRCAKYVKKRGRPTKI